MKFFLGCFLVFFSFSVLAHTIPTTIEQGQVALIYNLDKTLLAVTCGRKAGADIDKIDLESGSSFVVTLGSEMLVENDNNGELEFVKAGHGVKINCK